VKIRALVTCAALSLLLLWAANAAAQAQPSNPPPANPPPADPPPAQPRVKAPAPPLFPRHRRGLYRNAHGVEFIDATPQSPPLETDDPGVPDDGQYEINLSAHLDYAKAKQRLDLMLVDANYGIVPVIARYTVPTQIKFEFPVAVMREAGGTYTLGLGAARLGLKFNFYHDDRRGISVSVYPQVEFPATGSVSVRKGLADDGQTIIVPLLVAREFHEFTFVCNGSIEKPVHDPERQMTSEFGVGFGRAFTRKVAAMIELRTASSLDFKKDRLVFVNAGFIHGVRNVVVYANLGHSLLADDGGGHTYAGVGIKVQIDTKTRSDSR
jgi:hypothetical protein